MFATRCHQIARLLYSTQNTITSQRSISTTLTLQENYYESLGISPTSTQTDIKAAYYKLSMIYHPDKNKGSGSASKKFQEITQAYEVLSNYRLRKLYDKGIIHTAGPQYAHAENIRHDIPEEEEDPQTKFYKSRFSKSKVTNTQGQTPIYNFDEWARSHYGKTFDRRKAAKATYDRKSTQRHDNAMILQNEISIFGVLVGCVIFYMIVFMEQSYDTPASKKEKVKDE